MQAELHTGLGPIWPGPGWGPVRVGARSGLGPGPGWGPVRVGAHMGPHGPIYGPIWVLMGPWALMGPPEQVLEDYVNFPSTFRKTFGQISHVSGPKLNC